MSDTHKTVIIGSGPAGLTAAIYAARANLKPVVLAGPAPGGQLTKTSEVENFPGFRHGVLGTQLMEDMLEQAKWCGAEVLWESATQIAGRARPFTITTDGGRTLRSHTVIYATGAAPRMLGLETESHFMPPKGSGITSCAVCDGGFYRGKPVAVIGGGDSAMEEANYLAHLCSSVTIIHRREGLRASPVMVERARSKANIHWELNQVLVEYLGDPAKRRLTGVRLKSVKDGAVRDLPFDAVFLAIGHTPATSLLKGLVELDDEGYVKVDDKQSTSVPGLFAAGDCHDRRYRQAVTAAGLGCMAALEVDRYLTREGV